MWRPTNGRPTKHGVVVHIVPANTPAKYKQIRPGEYPIVIDDDAVDTILQLRDKYSCRSAIGTGLPRNFDSHIVLSIDSLGNDCLYWPDAKLVVEADKESASEQIGGVR